MHRKKYFILLPPALIIGIFLLYYLSPEDRAYIFLAPFAFWIAYYIWIYIERKKIKQMGKS